MHIPITRKKKSHNQCWKLIQPIEKLLTKWGEKCVSYGGKIQLVTWIVSGTYTYWAQGTTLQCSVVTKVRKLSYQFIWDRRKGIPWKKMGLPKERRARGYESANNNQSNDIKKNYLFLRGGILHIDKLDKRKIYNRVGSWGYTYNISDQQLTPASQCGNNWSTKKMK